MTGLFKKQTAARERVKLMIALTGPSGSGKTFSALQLAYGMTGDWKKIAVADTENRSALYYAGEKTGEWEHIDFPPTLPQGYHPHNWINLIKFVEADPNTDVLILDSISHEWQGTGGCLQIADNVGKGFSAWKTVTPLHNQFVDAMRNTRLHIIATMRVATDYHIGLNEKGKAAPTKVGLKSNQREGVDYEFGIVFDVDINHNATSSKDRTGIFANRTPFLITPLIGQELLVWAKEGKEVTAPQTPQPKLLFDMNNPKHTERFEKAMVELKATVGDPLKALQDFHGKPFSKESLEAFILQTFKPTEDVTTIPSQAMVT